MFDFSKTNLVNCFWTNLIKDQQPNLLKFDFDSPKQIDLRRQVNILLITFLGNEKTDETLVITELL